MENIKLSLDKNKKYVVACSFGPDSMALLDLALKEGLNVVVAHVNYRRRKESQLEQDQLKEYCDQREIRFYLLDLINETPTGNFQSWARKQRYEFFKTVVEKEEADSVLVAHQQDDVIETYLMQKNRKNIVKTYGISRENTIFGVKIIRPLLDYSKRQLVEYDKENHIPFAIDSSNLTNHYTRNKIRHSVVEKLSKEEREQIIKEISTKKFIFSEFKTEYTNKEFQKFDYHSIVQLLDFFMNKTGEHRDLSEGFVNEIKKSFSSNTNHRVEITTKIFLELNYGCVYIVNAAKLNKYKFSFASTFKNDFIDLDFSNGASDRGIGKLPSCLVIKNCCKNDTYIIKDYSCEIRRLFIDWKMPLFLREIWPGIYDEKGKLVYIPRYRKNFVDNHESKFKINTKYFTQF